MNDISSHSVFSDAQIEFLENLIRQSGESKKSTGLWRKIKNAGFKVALLSLAGATALAGEALDKTSILAQKEMMAHSDWQTNADIHLATETDRLQFIFFGKAVGRTVDHYFITNDPEAKTEANETRILVDAADQVISKTRSLVEGSDRVTRLSGDITKSIAGQRGMDGVMGHPVNGLRLVSADLGHTNDEIAISLGHDAFAALETQQKTTGIPVTGDWARYKIWQERIELRNTFAQARNNFDAKKEDIQAGWHVMVNGRDPIEPPPAP